MSILTGKQLCYDKNQDGVVKMKKGKNVGDIYI